MCPPYASAHAAGRLRGPPPDAQTSGPPADASLRSGSGSTEGEQHHHRRLRTPAPPRTGHRRTAAPTHTRDATRSSSPSLMMLVLLATIGVLAYATFIFRPSHHGDLLPFALVVTAETFLIAQALLALWTILSSGYDARDFSYHQAKRSLFDPGQILAQGLESDPEPLADAAQRGEGLGRRLHHHLRRGPRRDPPHRLRRAGDARPPPHLRARRRQVPTRSARWPPSSAPSTSSSRGQRAAPRPATSTTRCSITDGEFFVILDADFAPAAGVPAPDGAVLRRPTRSPSSRPRRPTETCTT